jgi:tetratricopeptide (TPR) repeat protein
MQIFNALPEMARASLFAVCAAAFVAAAPARADDIEDAAKLLKTGQHPQALERVNRVLSANPRNAQARFLKGLIYTDQGNTREAIEIFTRLTQDYPELPEPYNNLAVIYASQGQFEKARGALEQSIRTHPSYATAYENLGDVYAKLASQAYDKALQLDSSNTAAQNKLSLVRDLVGGPAAVAAKEPAKPPVVVAQKPPEKPPVAAVKPAPAPEKPAPVAEKPAANASVDVLKTLNGWAQAWSKKDVDGYLSYYARDFKTPKGEPRDQWEKDRRARISAPKSIAVEIATPKVVLDGPSQARVTFRQTYRSDVFKGTSSKTVVMLKGADGRWQIQEEKAG